MAEFDHVPIETLDLSKRTYHALARSGILTVGDLREFCINRDKQYIRNVGSSVHCFL